MRRGFGALVAALVLVVSACGASDPIAAEEVSAAATKTASSGSSRIALTGEDETATFAMEGVADYEGRRASFTYDIAGKPGQDGLGNVEAELRMIGRTFYIESSIFGPGVQPGASAKLKPWLSTTFETEDEATTLEMLVFPFPFIDPVRLLATFEQVSGDVASLGDEDVRGTPTKRYRLTLDLEHLIETAPALHRPALRKELEARETKTMPIEVWIDDVGRARRVRLDESAYVTTVDFFDFGVEVDVEAPPADQVEDFDTLFEADSGSGSGELVPPEEDG